MGCLVLLLAAALAVTFPPLGVPVLALVVLWGLLSNSLRKRRIRRRRERILVERATERERKRLKRKARAEERSERREKKRLARRVSRNQLKGRGRDVEPEKRFSTAPKQQGSTHQSLPIRLLQEALDREGRLTVTQGVTATEESFQAVEACLESMATKGYVDVDNHPESGAVVYVFAAEAPKAPVFRQRRKAIEREIRQVRKRRGVPTSAEPVQLSSLLLYEAQERGGRLTVTQGVMATGKSYEAVEACLQGMVDNRYVDGDSDPGSGVVVYVFAEMTAKTSDDRVSEPRSVQVRAAVQALLGGIRRVRGRRRGKQPEPTDSQETPNSDDADKDGEHSRSIAADGLGSDETPETDSAEHGGAARSRTAVGSSVNALRRGLAGVGRAAGAVGDGVAGSARTVARRVSDVSVRAGRRTADSLTRVPVRRLPESVASKASNLGNALLGTDVAVTLDRWTRSVFASGPATRYDKALDQVYNAFGEHGADHRLFDGSHDLVGAWKTIAKSFPDEGWLQRAEGYVSAIWKDMATPSGIPVVTWDKQAFDAVATFLNETLGVSRTWVKDMATFTATEFVGAVLGAVALVLSWNKAEIRRFSEIVGSLGLSALVGASPLLVMVTIVGLAKCFHEARYGAEFKRILSGGGRGMGGAMALLGASRLMPAPAWVTVMVGVVSYLVATKLYDKAEPKAEEVARNVRDWFGSQEWTESCSELARNTYLRGKAVVGSVSESELANDVANTVSAWSHASARAIGSGWSTGYRNAIRVACAAVPQWTAAGR